MKKAKFFSRLLQALGAGSTAVVMMAILWILFYSSLPTATKQAMLGLLVLIAWTVVGFGTLSFICVMVQWATKLPTPITWLQVACAAVSFSAALWMTNQVLFTTYKTGLPIILEVIIAVAGMLLACAAFSCARKA